MLKGDMIRDPILLKKRVAEAHFLIKYYKKMKKSMQFSTSIISINKKMRMAYLIVVKEKKKNAL